MRFQQGVEQRPVGHGIRAILHRLRLAIGTGYGAGIQMVATDHNRRLQRAAPHHFIELQSGAMAVAEADPADACGQSLERDARLRHVEPAMQVRVRRETAPSRPRRSCRCPPDHPTARPSGTGRCRGRTGGGCKRARNPGSRRRSRRPRPSRPGGCCCRSRRSGCPRGEGEHGFDMLCDGGLGSDRNSSRIARAFGFPLRDGPAFGEIAVHDVMGAGLVGHRVGMNAALHQLRQDLGSIAQQADGQRGLLAHRAVDQRKCLVEICRRLVEIARLDPLLDARALAFDGEHARRRPSWRRAAARRPCRRGRP